MAQSQDRGRRPGQIWRALTVEVGEGYDAITRDHIVPIEPEPLRHPIYRECAVERGGQWQKQARGVREPGHIARRIGGPRPRHQIGRAGGAETHDGSSGLQSQTQRRTHVVAGTGADKSAHP